MASHKPGYITASIASGFLTGAKADVLIKGTKSACAKIASEILEQEGYCHFDPIFDSFEGNKYTEYGNAYEPEAIKRYEELVFEDVHGKQDAVVNEVNMLSCTPDGLVGSDGLIEVKTITKVVDWVDLSIDEQLKKHYDQIQFQIMLTGRSWCDLVLYQPRFKYSYNIVVSRVYEDKQWREFADTRLPLCRQLIDRIVETFKQRGKK